MARTPGNSVIEWMGLKDSNGVNIADYHLMFKSSGIDPVAGVALTLVTIISLLMSTLLGIALGLASLITSSSTILEGVANFTQMILDAIHSVFNPLIIAVVAFMFVIMRQLMPDYVIGKDKFTNAALGGSKLKGTRIGGVDYSSGSSVDIRKFTDVIFRGVVVILVVVFISANPFALIVRAMDFVGNFGNAIAGQAEGGVMGYATSMYQTLFSLINFGSVPDSCADIYSRDMVNGTNMTWTCIGQTETKAGFDHVMLSVLAIIVSGTLAYFLWKAFLQGSLFLAYVVADFITIPYKLSWKMFKSEFDEDSRSIYDYVFNTVSRLVVYFAFYLLIVFMMTSVPTLLIYAIASAVTAVAGDGAAAAFLVLIIVAIAFYAGGKWIHLVYPRIEGDDRAQNWSMFAATFVDKYAPMERDAVTGKFVVRDTFKETIKENTVVAKVMTAAGIDPRAHALTEDQKAVLALAKADVNDTFTRQALRDMKKAEGQIERDKLILDKRVSSGKLTSEQAVAAYKALEDRQATLAKISEAFKTHKDNVSNAVTELVPAHLLGRDEFKGSSIASLALIDEVRRTVAREEFEKRTGVSADDQDMWNNIYTIFSELEEEKEKLEKDRADGSLSRKKYEAKLADLQPRLDKAAEIREARQDYDTHGALKLSELVSNPYYDKDFALLSSDDVAKLPDNDMRFISRADEKRVTYGELLAMSRVIDRERSNRANIAATGFAYDSKWDSAETDLAQKQALLNDLKSRISSGELTAKDAAKATTSLTKEIEDLKTLVSAKAQYLDPSQRFVTDPRLVNAGEDKIKVPIPNTGQDIRSASDIVLALATAKRRETQNSMWKQAQPAVDVLDHLKFNAYLDSGSVRHAITNAVAAAQQLIPMSQAAGYEDSDFDTRVARSQELMGSLGDHSTEQDIREVADKVSGLLHAPSTHLIRDFINARSENAMLAEMKSVIEGYKVQGQTVNIPMSPHTVIPSVPITWVDSVDEKELFAQAQIIKEKLKGIDSSVHASLIYAASRHGSTEKDGSVLVKDLAGDSVAVPHAVVDRVKEYATPTYAYMEEFNANLRKAISEGANDFVDTVRERSAQQQLFTFVNEPVRVEVEKFNLVDAHNAVAETVRGSLYAAATASDSATHVAAIEQQQPRTPSGEGTKTPPAEVDEKGTPTSAAATFTGEQSSNIVASSQHINDMADSISRDSAQGGGTATSTRVFGGGTVNADPKYLFFEVTDSGEAIAKKNVWR